MTRGSFNQLINIRKRVAVLRVCFIDVSIINTHYLTSIRLFNEYNISEPLGVLHFDDKPCF